MELNVKVGLIGALDMLKFKNLSKTRREAIEELPERPLPKTYETNEKAEFMHPKYQNVRIKEMRPNGPDAVTVTFQSMDGKALAPFRAGQYISISVDADESATTRSYSLCGSPERSWQGAYDITVKRVEDDGFVSKFIQDKWIPGLAIRVSAPQGHLYYEPLRDEKKVLALAGGRFRSSPALAADAGRELLGAVWRLASAEYRENGKTLFTACFGEKRSSRWHPLENALYYSQDPPEPRDCVLSPALRYSFRDGVWREQSYQKLHFDKKKLESLLRETDRRLRLYLKTGRPLQERPEDAWAAPFIEAVLAADRAARRAQERPRITIRFDDLEQIRRDAVQTRESLLTEEDKRESEAALPQPSVPEPQSEAPVLPLEAEQIELLRLLLRGESARAWIAQRHLMASVAADALNEALFDELGDAAVDCDGTEITLVEDYREAVHIIIRDRYRITKIEETVLTDLISMHGLTRFDVGRGTG